MNAVLSFFNNNLGLVTLLIGVVAYLIYLKQRSDAKKDAAKIILQEIRRAEGIISGYKESGLYQFTKKIIVNNSWAKNISYFVGDLEIDELDKITNLYSTGEYLDSIIQKISDYQFAKRVEDFEKTALLKAQEITSQLQPQQTIPQPGGVSGGQITSGQTTVVPRRKLDLSFTMETPWKPILEEITLKYEPIYNSSICQKLKKIAGLMV